MTPEDFKRQYLCEFPPDPELQKIVAFLRYATDKDIRAWRRDGLMSSRQYRDARMILEREES